MHTNRNDKPSRTSSDPWPLIGPWQAVAEMWAMWSEVGEVVAKERLEKTKELLTRTWNPEFWRTGGLAPFLAELQEVLSLPRLADLPNVDMNALQPMNSMFEVVGLLQQYLSISVPLWMTISQRFQAELAARKKAGDGVKSHGATLDLWNSVVDRALMEFNRSVEFADIQRRLLRASANCRLQMRAIGERSARLFDMPTRSEMIDAYRRIHDMQREIQQLRREIRTLRNDRKSDAASPKPKTLRGAR